MQVRDLALPADVLSARKARRFAVEALEGWGVGPFAHDVELCVGELVANVVLHARTPVWVSLQLHDDALVVEVRDGQRVDVALPTAADAESAAEAAVAALDAALVANATTGRGLLVVASIADELGVDVGAAGKTVWFVVHLEPMSPPEPRELTEDRMTSGPAAPGLRTVALRSLPVKTSLANGANVDDLAREVRLMTLGTTPHPGVSVSELEQLDRMLHRTARGRLAGRRLARKALAAGREHYDLELNVSPSTVADLEDLNAALAHLDRLARDGVFLCTPAGEDVTAFRAWIVTELSRQLAGEPARAFR